MINSDMNIELAVRYITGSASEAERTSFDSWLNATDNHRNQFDAFRAYWDIAGSSYDDYEPDLLFGWENVSRETVHKKVVLFRQKSVSIQFMRIAAVILLLLAGWYGGRLVVNKVGLPESQLFVYSTADMLKKLQLADGSVVWLNKNSVLRIPASCNQKKRSVVLEGEAYFEVAKNADIPYIIKANQTVTEVVGTSFNVRAQNGENKVRVTVYSGLVTFYPADDKKAAEVLKAGDRGIYKTDSKEFWKEITYVPNDLAWKTGTLRFKNTPLAEVCEMLSEYYNTKVEATPEISNSKHFTGNFQKASLNEILDIIELTLDIEFVKKDNRMLAQP